MDLLYSRYASPMELMQIYINQGRFGEFVTEVLEMNYKRKLEEAEKENDHKLWDIYVKGVIDKSFTEWKKELMSQSQTKPISYVMTDDQVQSTIDKSRQILKKSKIK